jgi:hypothetical protein
MTVAILITVLMLVSTLLYMTDRDLTRLHLQNKLLQEEREQLILERQNYVSRRIVESISRDAGNIRLSRTESH